MYLTSKGSVEDGGAAEDKLIDDALAEQLGIDPMIDPAANKFDKFDTNTNVVLTTLQNDPLHKHDALDDPDIDAMEDALGLTPEMKAELAAE